MSHPFAEASQAPFVSVGRVDDWTDGQAREVKVHKKPMTVVRMKDRFFAINSICPHMGGPLSCGKVEQEKIYCPWHEWGFDVTTGESPNGHRVERYQVKVEAGEVLIGWILR